MAGREQRAQRVAGERGERDRVAAVAGDVAEQHADAVLVEREDVVEVAARGGAVGGPVGGRDGEAVELGDRREQRAGEQPDVVEQLEPLRLERGALARLAEGVAGQAERDRGDAEQRPQDRVGQRLDEVDRSPAMPGVVAGAVALRAGRGGGPRGRCPRARSRWPGRSPRGACGA